MDRSITEIINSGENADRHLLHWLSRPVEERYYAVEFLRAQWIEMNNLPTKMDRTFFEYR
jgi:hypothetical protein